MTDELKPVRCGCGGEAEIDWVLEPSNCYMANVYCNKCGTKTIPFWSEDKDKAIDYAVTTWNRAISGSAEEKLKAFWDGMSAEMKEETNTTDPNEDFHPVRDCMAGKERTAKVIEHDASITRYRWLQISSV